MLMVGRSPHVVSRCLLIWEVPWRVMYGQDLEKEKNFWIGMCAELVHVVECENMGRRGRLEERGKGANTLLLRPSFDILYRGEIEEKKCDLVRMC